MEATSGLATIDAVLIVSLMVTVVIILLGAYRWAYLNGFWDVSPAPREQPVWQKHPSVKSSLRIPDSKLAFLDVETEPSGRLWCIGICEGESAPVQFVARELSEERYMLEEFVEYAWSKKDYVFCYYAGIRKFDETVLRARLRAYDLPSEFFVMKDMFHTVRASLRVQRYGLKYVGARLGYRFSHWELDGRAASVLWKRYVRARDEQLLRKLIEYNLDDAKALCYVVDWFKKKHPDSVRREPVKWRTIKRISSDSYEVPSFTREETYTVNTAKGQCTCPISRECKHLRLVTELAESPLGNHTTG